MPADTPTTPAEARATEEREALTAIRNALAENVVWSSTAGRRVHIAKIDAALAAPRPDTPASVGLRAEVLAFAHLMEAQLQANDHKPGWKGERPGPLWERLREEADELLGAVDRWATYDTSDRGARLGPAHWSGVVGKEAADVANFAMMIADVCGALAATAQAER